MVGKSGRFTTAKSQGAKSRPYHCCFDTQHHLAMWQSRKVYCSPPLQAAQKFWQTWSINPRYYSKLELRWREKRRVHRRSQAFGKKKYSENTSVVTVQLHSHFFKCLLNYISLALSIHLSTIFWETFSFLAMFLLKRWLIHRRC